MQCLKVPYTDYTVHIMPEVSIPISSALRHDRCRQAAADRRAEGQAWDSSFRVQFDVFALCITTGVPLLPSSPKDPCTQLVYTLALK